MRWWYFFLMSGEFIDPYLVSRFILCFFFSWMCSLCSCRSCRIMTALLESIFFAPFAHCIFPGFICLICFYVLARGSTRTLDRAAIRHIHVFVDIIPSSNTMPFIQSLRHTHCTSNGCRVNRNKPCLFHLRYNPDTLKTT